MNRKRKRKDGRRGYTSVGNGYVGGVYMKMRNLKSVCIYC